MSEPAAQPSKESTPLVPESDAKKPKEDMEAKDAPPWAACFGVGTAATAGISIALQMGCGIGMSLSNKAVTNVIHAPCLITVIQMVFTVLWLTPQVLTGGSGRHFGSKADAIRWSFGPPIFYGLQLSASMIGIAKLSLAEQTNVRNLGPWITLPLERFITEKTPVSVQTLLALLTITVGVALFFLADSQAAPPNLVGVVWIVLNMGFAISGRMLERRFLAIEKLDISITGTLLLNNIIGIVPVVVVLFCQNEQAYYPQLASVPVNGWILVLVTCFIGVGIGWTGLLVQRQVSATAMLTITNMNKFCVILIAMVLFGENSGWVVLTGCVIALTGGLWYGYAGVRQKELKKKAAETLPGDSSPAAGVLSCLDKEL
jgi:drug/metabolite transporter (DMT)-like permease